MAVALNIKLIDGNDTFLIIGNVTYFCHNISDAIIQFRVITKILV